MAALQQSLLVTALALSLALIVCVGLTYNKIEKKQEYRFSGETFEWDYCKNFDQNFSIENAKFIPSKLIIGSTTRAELAIDSPKELVVTRMSIKVKFGFITIPASKFDLEEPIKVPVGKSLQGFEFELPKSALPGKYKGSITFLDESGKEVECIKGRFKVSKKA